MLIDTVIGRTIAHYEIRELLGEGGMGQVFRATDTRLKREVALKILPESFSTDPQRMGRFQREAEVLASLNHPNIAGIHGLEHDGDTHAIAMELVEGETLAARISRGAIPLEETLKIALQIAEALEAAHEKGIIHRDLKPANVIVTPEGTAKVLDFGLAKAMDPEPSSQAELSQSPTLTMQATQAGIILGTAAYMSPEQAKGKPVDKRADNWAFGVVLFEMLTGVGAFGGNDITEVLAAVVMKDPEWHQLPSDLPATIRRVLQRCLHRETRSRLRDIGDARISIQEYLADPEADTTEPTKSLASVPLWQQPLAIAVVLLALATGLLAAWFLKPVPESQEVPITKTPITVEQFEGRQSPPVVSPDGEKLVYRAGGQLWLRYLDRFEAEPLADSDAAQWPFFSPDSLFIAYQQDNKLRKVNLSTGAKTTLCDLPGTGVTGLSWAEAGSIVFGSRNGLYEVSDQGGDPQRILEPNRQAGETGLDRPHYLPETRGLVFTVRHSGDDYIDMVADGERTTLIKQEGASFGAATYSNSGHLLYRRDGGNEGLWAMPFSVSTLAVSDRRFLIDSAGNWPSVSDEGRLSYIRGATEDRYELVWMDRSGQVQATIGQPQPGIFTPSLSPDGKWVAVSANEEGNRDIWLHDVGRGSKRRLSFGEGETWTPAWTASGDQVAFQVNSASGMEIWIRHTDDGSDAVRLTDGRYPHFSADGSYLVFDRESPETGRDLWYLEVGKEEEPKPFLVTESHESRPRLSSDSRWIAYVSNESGQTEVYVKKFPSGEGLWQISTNRGRRHRWSSDGDELFYLEGRDLMVVPLQGTDSLNPGTPTKLFTLLAPAFQEYGVTKGGDRFILPRPFAGHETPPSIAIVQNWISEFRDRQ